jgi:hypothetical protein
MLASNARKECRHALVTHISVCAGIALVSPFGTPVCVADREVFGGNSVVAQVRAVVSPAQIQGAVVVFTPCTLDVRSPIWFNTGRKERKQEREPEAVSIHDKALDTDERNRSR